MKVHTDGLVRQMALGWRCMISRPDDHSMIIMLKPIGHGHPDMDSKAE